MHPYIQSLQMMNVKVGLESTTKILAALGNPQHSFKSIHIAGTNGKGSVAMMLASILAQKHNVGLYTSPHLFTYNQRIQVQGVPISDIELYKIVDMIKNIAEREKITLSFFECTTCVALYYFAQQKVDYAVVEVGLGGRFDATNVLHPILCLITSIGYDHQHILGNTKKKIAFEKAGIIKQNIPVITSTMTSFFRSIAQQRGAPYIKCTSAKKGSQQLNSQTVIWNNKQYTIPVLGNHQVQNVSLVLSATKYLGISQQDTQKGLREVKVLGRMQVLSTKPLILVDGAHNQDGFKAVYEYVKTIPHKKVILIALTQEKNPVLIKPLASLFEHVIITQGGFKAQCPHTIAQVLQLPQMHTIPHIKKAVQQATCLLQSNDCLLVTGSLYMIGDALQVLQHTAPVQDSNMK